MKVLSEEVWTTQALSHDGNRRPPIFERLGGAVVPLSGQISMIINETLRLCPPTVMRRVLTQLRLGSLDIHSSAGTEMYMVLAAAHRDTEFWGEDSNSYNPLRFGEPRKHLASFVPFSLGHRICVGQHLALVEAKIALPMIIRRFSLAVSPSYAHAPSYLFIFLYILRLLYLTF